MTSNIDERLTRVETQAVLADKRALSAVNGLATLEQGLTRVERELKAVRKDVAVGFTSIREQLKKIHDKKERATASLELSHEDFEETSTGTHYKVTKDTITRVLAAQKEREDAQAWRSLWKRVRWAVWAIVGGGATLGGEQLVQYLLKHL